MVLVTASTISVAISSGIVCIFTFLLFLSGYVLQQQTVRSLQDALRNPPEKIALPTPTLPVQFQATHDDDKIGNAKESQRLMLSDSAAQSVLRSEADEVAIRKLWQDYVHAPSRAEDLESGESTKSPSETEKSSNEDMDWIASKERLAYIFNLPDTDSLCSAILFVKRHKEVTRLMVQPSIVFLYPAGWDVSDSQLHLAAMDGLRDMQDSFSVTLHPVSISRVWAGVSAEQQLLAELQRYRWSYDRALFLSSPGMLIDTLRLDQALALSDIKASWTLLHPSPKSYEASHPSMLMWASGRGLLYPRHEMKTVIAKATTSHDNNHADEIVAEAASKEAAYITFDEKELRHRQSERRSYGGLFERFERDRREACSEFGLYDAE